MGFIMELEANHGFSVLPAWSNDEVVDIVTNSPMIMKEEYFNLKVITSGQQKPLSEKCKNDFPEISRISRLSRTSASRISGSKIGSKISNPLLSTSAVQFSAAF